MVIVNSNCYSCYAAIVPEAVREFENQLEDKAKAVLEFNNDTSIFLIGMMASGKSTVGRIVADALSYHFADRYEVILVVWRVMQDISKCHSYYMDLTICVPCLLSTGRWCNMLCLCHNFSFDTLVTILLYFESDGFCA